MKIFWAVMLLACNNAWSDAYVCQEGKTRVIRSSPCEENTKTLNVVSDPNPNYEDNRTDGEKLKAQLNRVQTNRQEIARQQETDRPRVAPQPQIDKSEVCEKNWEAIRAIDASARYNSTQWHRDEKRRLQDERWKIGC